MRAESGLSNFWYPLLISDELAEGEVCEQRLFDTPIAVFRNKQGIVNAIEDSCAHRSAPLSKGQVVGDYLRCPYHGWSYDGAGQCQSIPALEPSKPVPKAARVRSFPVIEQCGLIWVWPGDPSLVSAKPEMAAVEQECAESGEWQVTNYQRELNFRHSLLLENLIDPAHIHFVHQGTMSTPENAGPVIPSLEIHDGGFISGGGKKGFGVNSEFIGPAAVVLYFNFGNSRQVHIFYCVPTTATKMKLLTRIYTPVGSRSQQSLIAGVETVLNEDIVILTLVEKRLQEGYPPIGVPIKADLAITEYHRWCRQHQGIALTE